MAIIHDQEIIFSEALGYTDLEQKTPATIDSKYPVLSVTKTFTATMFMQLVETNKIGLQDDVRKYVPEYGLTSSSGEKSGTKLLQLATHTSGLPRNSPADIRFAKQIDGWMLTQANNAGLQPATIKEFHGN